ncbi:MAG: hypothetical protein ACREJ3_08300 [Polyangiaceae bacterium]
MTDPVQAVGQLADVADWSEPVPRLPTDYLAIVTTTLPLFGMAFFIGFFLVRSLP